MRPVDNLDGPVECLSSTRNTPDAEKESPLPSAKQRAFLGHVCGLVVYDKQPASK